MSNSETKDIAINLSLAEIFGGLFVDQTGRPCVPVTPEFILEVTKIIQGGGDVGKLYREFAKSVDPLLKFDDERSATLVVQDRKTGQTTKLIHNKPKTP